MVTSSSPESFRPLDILGGAANPQAELLKLQEHVQEGQFDKLVDSLMGTATEKKEVPPAKIDAFVRGLSPAELASLETFLGGKPADPRAAALRERVKALKGDTAAATAEKPAEGLEGLSEPAQKVIAALDKGIARLTSGGRLNEIAAKIGFKGEIGPQQLEFVKNYALGWAAKLFEGLTASIKKVNPTADMSRILNLPLELRLLNIKDPVQREKYKALYLKRAKESTGAFVAPTLEEALNPEVASATPAAPETKPAEVAPAPVATGEKVTDVKRTVKLTDGTIFDVQRSDKKTTVTAGGVSAEMKIVGGETLDVFALDAKDASKATVTVKLVDDRSVSIDAETLRNAVQGKKPGEKKEVTASDGSTKIELI